MNEQRWLLSLASGSAGSPWRLQQLVPARNQNLANTCWNVEMTTCVFVNLSALDSASLNGCDPWNTSLQGSREAPTPYLSREGFFQRLSLKLSLLVCNLTLQESCDSNRPQCRMSQGLPPRNRQNSEKGNNMEVFKMQLQ